MVKRGAGLLELAGHSTLAWTVEAGTLAASAQRFTGDLAIAGGAGCRFDREAEGTYAGTLSGAGALGKRGAGGLTLAGDSSGFTGTTTVSAGTLRVDGMLGGRVSVEDGATLGGAGTVGGDVTVSGGTLSGEQGQTLEIGGDLALDAGS